MNDDILVDSYMKSLINIDINKEEFAQYMTLFSKYLSYTNPDYKYNGTYLNQYTDEFIKSCEELKYKNDIYNQIFLMLVNGIKIPFELTIDNSYYVYFDKIENFEKIKLFIRDMILKKLIAINLKSN